MSRGSPARLEALARAFESACRAKGVACVREPIPYGLKLTLSQGAAEGVVALYATGKVVPNPKARAQFADVLELACGAPGAPRSSSAGAPGARADPSVPSLRPALLVVPYPSLGSDESGKGDYFGPLVAAAVVIADAREAELMVELGVRDSKALASAGQAREIAAQVREVARGRLGERVCPPIEYNRRFEELKARGQNSHQLLAELHIDAMALASAGLRPALGLTDKFGGGKEIERERKRRGLTFAVRQETRGERWVAVAAASILARDRCLEWFETAEREAGTRLPRGAFDPGIVTAARRLFARGGLDELSRYAKLHFRTTERVTR